MYLLLPSVFALLLRRLEEDRSVIYLSQTNKKNLAGWQSQSNFQLAFCHSAVISTQTMTEIQSWRNFCWKNCVHNLQNKNNKQKCWTRYGQLTADHICIFGSCTTLQPFAPNVFCCDFPQQKGLWDLISTLPVFHSICGTYIYYKLSWQQVKAITRCGFIENIPTLTN